MAKQKAKEVVDGVKATRTLAGKTEERYFTKQHLELIGTDPEHNGGWQVEGVETPAELGDEDPDKDPEL